VDAIPRKADGRRIFSAHFKKDSVALQMLSLTTNRESRPELSASILQAFLRAGAGTGVRPTGRRCSSGRHVRSICLFSMPWGRRSGRLPSDRRQTQHPTPETPRLPHPGGMLCPM